MIALSIVTLVVYTTHRAIHLALARLLAHNQLLMSKMFLVDGLALNIVEDILHGGNVLVLCALILRLGRQNLEYAVVQVLLVSQQVRGVLAQELLPSTNMFFDIISQRALAVAVEQLSTTKFDEGMAVLVLLEQRAEEFKTVALLPVGPLVPLTV